MPLPLLHRSRSQTESVSFWNSKLLSNPSIATIDVDKSWFQPIWFQTKTQFWFLALFDMRKLSANGSTSKRVVWEVEKRRRLTHQVKILVHFFSALVIKSKSRLTKTNQLRFFDFFRPNWNPNYRPKSCELSQHTDKPNSCHNQSF